jgi:hypothetical protein
MDFTQTAHLTTAKQQKFNNLAALNRASMGIIDKDNEEKRADSAESMMEEYERKRRKQVAAMRSILDYGIGTLIMAAGVFLFIRNRLDLSFNEKFPPNDSDKIIGVVFVIYGLWRVYRGYRKNYFK